ncbi:MAG: type II secretion system F family protein [Candidatus Omnitrophica bacterium]|nr:type II secretion system F family protein [Candidatus Omnitrophota bacterium]MCM8826543.1 type II secretion system F family protein [Candidatus Omnitrophota bacterium]
MGIYIYKALDQQGRTVKGEIEAEGELDASKQLAQLGYLPISIGFKGETPQFFLERFFTKKKEKVSLRCLIVFTRQFATIVKAAVPIVEGLGVLAEQSDDESLKEALNHIVHDIEGGEKLSDAMAKHPNVFNDLYVNTVVAGEAGGVLDKVLLRLANVLEEDNETMMNIKSAFRYPIMVIVALFVAIIIFSFKVIPEFSKIYATLKGNLPLPTQVMIFISHSLQGPWRNRPEIYLKIIWYLILMGAMIGIWTTFKWFINTPRGRYWWDGFKFRIFIFGKIYNKIVMLRFASMLNVLYQSGLPILHILDIVKITVGNVVLSQEINSVKKDIADGKGISGGILASKFFPRLAGYMISIGEKTGSLSLMLDSLCEYFTLEVRSALKTLSSLIEPIMTLILGIVVSFMALAVFMPMWNLIRVFKQG